MPDTQENIYLDIDQHNDSILITLNLSNRVGGSDLSAFTDYTNHELDHVENDSALIIIDTTNLTSLTCFACLKLIMFGSKYSTKFNKIALLKPTKSNFITNLCFSSLANANTSFENTDLANEWLKINP